MAVTRAQSLTLLVHGASDIGKVREQNQDSFCIGLPENEEQRRARGKLLVLADGMGGLAHGGRASEIAAASVLETYYENPNDGEAADALVRAAEKANSDIFREAQSLPGGQPMGSTLTTIAFVEEGAVIAQVGDSRAYRISDGKEIEQLTRDHTLVQELADRGEIEPDSLHYLLNRNVLTRGLGLQDDVEVDIVEVRDLVEGDTFLLCSDGLYEVIADSEVQSHVLSHGSALEGLVGSLLELALSRGAPDNVTIIVARVSSGGDEDGGATAGGEAGDAVGERAREILPAAVLGPVTYFLVFALGAILALLLQGDAPPRTADESAGVSLRQAAERVLGHPGLDEYEKDRPGAELRKELDSLLEWGKDSRVSEPEGRDR